MAQRRLWTREEHILALSLYFQLPFGKLHKSTKEVAELAKLINRTVNSVALRLVNYAACDPYILATGRHGMAAGAQQCMPYWNEFATQKETLFYEAEKIKAKLQGATIEETLLDNQKQELLNLTGKTREQLVKARVNQNVFRTIILTNYQSKCAITGIDIPDLLVASHIIPWADNEKERLNPSNGICLSSLYDRAFDKGLIAIDPNDYTVILSRELLEHSHEEYFNNYFLGIQRKEIVKPIEYNPNPEFLQYHIDNIFSCHD